MKKHAAFVVAVCALVASGATLVFAQADDGPPPGGGRHHHHPPLPLMKALDTNGDGTIDANEIANAPAALKTLDKNGDGKLTPDEYLPVRPDGSVATPPPGPDGKTPPPPPLVAALDLNGDGVIDADEIAAASTSLKTLDKNGDGKLTPDELRPKHPPRPPEDGGPGPDQDRGGPPPDGNGGNPPN